MAISGFLFLSWRLFEIVLLIPIVGMLGWFVSRFSSANTLTPDYVLVLFIVSVLALAWTFFTTISYLRARHDALFVALVDLGFFGALIGGVVVLRGIDTANCSNFNTNTFANLSSNSDFYRHPNKVCSMLKACFALAIIEIIAFFFTFLLALLVFRHHKNDDSPPVVVKREYHSSRHSHRRSGSRDYPPPSRDYRSSRDRGDRDYEYRPASSGRRSTQRSSSRRQYYV